MTQTPNDEMADPLLKKNIDSQFCSDWLKGEIHKLFDSLESKKAEIAGLRDRILDLRYALKTIGLQHCREFPDKVLNCCNYALAQDAACERKEK